MTRPPIGGFNVFCIFASSIQTGMKKIIKLISYIALAVVAAGCAKAVTEGPNAANIRYFEAWMKVNHPNLKPVGLGIYILEEEAGTGDVVKEDGYVYADYIVTDLEGNIASYTGAETAKQMGEYKFSNYYGPQVMTTIKQTIPAGVAEAVIGMKVGGRKKIIIPSWLMAYSSYETEEEYKEKVSESASAIYDIKITAYTDSIQGYEDELIKKYMKENPQIFNDRMVQPCKDTAFYFQPLSEPVEEPEKFPSDTTIYINYTGRLLNGQVFDTTIEDVAKDHKIYSSSRSYTPQKVTWGSDWSDITLGGSSIISGFALTLWQMHPMEKAIGVFTSPYGYTYNGSGKSIPAYAPLVFEIEIVAKPEE